MMPHTSRAFTVILALALAACAQNPRKAEPPAVAAKAATEPKGESELLMAGEMAARNGDCRVASESYQRAAAISSEVRVASRAAQVALGCNQLGAARAAIARWRQLEPWNGQAALVAAVVALKRYDLKESREALTAWRDSGAAGSQSPLAIATTLGEEAEATALYRVFNDVLVGPDPTAEVLLAQAQLAFAAQNMDVARKAAQRALGIDASLAQARSIELRAQSVLGDHEAAIDGARQLDRRGLEGEDIFLVADLLDAADREADAEQELQQLLLTPATTVGARQRLISMALRNGDLEGAEQQITALASGGSNTAIALLYFAELAARRGDDATAVQSYRLLGDSGLGLSARTSAARLMIRHGDISGAIALIDEFGEQNPDSLVEVASARATLLAGAGDMSSALATLDEADKAYPDDADLQYTRATVLESGGRTREAINVFETALKRRPEDPQLLNALGFTLADHKQQLGRAEDMVRTALAVSPDNPAIQDSLGWLLYRRGKNSQSLQLLSRAWQNSGDAEIAAHYGEVLWKAGQQDKARYVWQRALIADPAQGRLREVMSRLTGEDVASP